MKLYLAGPMRGVIEQNAPAFRQATELLRGDGHTVISPIEREEAEGFDFTDIFTVHADSFAWDIAQVLAPDTEAVVLLPGWEKSHGSAVERKSAQMFGKAVYYFSLTDHSPGYSLKLESVGDPRFHELLQEIGALHDRKQADYGSDGDPFANVRATEEWGMPAWVGSLMRLNDKVHRLKQFAQKGALANESAEDSMLDIAVYSLIALVLYRELEA